MLNLPNKSKHWLLSKLHARSKPRQRSWAGPAESTGCDWSAECMRLWRDWQVEMVGKLYTVDPGVRARPALPQRTLPTSAIIGWEGSELIEVVWRESESWRSSRFGFGDKMEQKSWSSDLYGAIVKNPTLCSREQAFRGRTKNIFNLPACRKALVGNLSLTTLL